MSTLTDADQARGLTEPEGDARDLAAKLADARRLAESAARTAARLTRERDEARESLAWWTEVQSCDLRHSEPFDFGGCETHDRTFPLGGACDHAGLSEVEWMEQREQEQRVRAIRAEEERDEARAQVAAVEQLIASWREGYPQSRTEFAWAVRECATGVELTLQRVRRG